MRPPGPNRTDHRGLLMYAPQASAAILQSPRLSRHIQSHVPTAQGRATVYGLTVHCTEVSGSSLFLPRPQALPLCDLPILGQMDPAEDVAAPDAKPPRILARLRKSGRGGCIQVGRVGEALAELKALSAKLAAALSSAGLAPDQPERSIR